jgi:cytochrome c556
MGARRISLVAAAFLLTACGSSATSAPPAADPQQTKIKFADGVCGAMAKFVEPATAFKADPNDPVNSLKKQLTALSTGLSDANADLAKVDTTGFPEGKDALTEMQKGFGQMKTTVDDAKKKLDAVNPSDQQAATKAVTDAGAQLAGLGEAMGDPFNKPGLSKADMETAAKQAPNCQEMEKKMGAS